MGLSCQEQDIHSSVYRLLYIHFEIKQEKHLCCQHLTSTYNFFCVFVQPLPTKSLCFFAAIADVHIPATTLGLLQSAFSLAASKPLHIFCHFIFLGVTILDQVETLYHSKLDIPSSCSVYILQPICFHYWHYLKFSLFLRAPSIVLSKQPFPEPCFYYLPMRFFH